MLLLALAVQGFSIAGFLITRSTLAFILVSVVFGLAWGTCVPLFPLILARYFGTRSMGSIYGLQFLGGQLGAALGPFLAGFTADLTGNYVTALIIGASVSVMGALLCTGLKGIRVEPPSLRLGV
jgi:MFS family permease